MLSFGDLIEPVRWLKTLWADQTHIQFLLPESVEETGTPLPVSDKGKRTGEVLFGITTTSEKPVEIVAVEVHFTTPLQIRDPEARGFFSIEGGQDTDFPFRAVWYGSAMLRARLIQAFALTAQFPDQELGHALRFIVHARRHHRGVGGFLVHGRTHLTMRTHPVALTSRAVMGLRLAPGWAFTTPQPYLTETTTNITSDSDGPNKVHIHQISKDGAVSSTTVEVPATKTPWPSERK